MVVPGSLFICQLGKLQAALGVSLSNYSCWLHIKYCASHIVPICLRDKLACLAVVNSHQIIAQFHNGALKCKLLALTTFSSEGLRSPAMVKKQQDSVSPKD